jgi:hypothetical protein
MERKDLSRIAGLESSSIKYRVEKKEILPQ